ncbi:MAG: AmmeMemoRadiSam system radical SAM enzyme [Spirochaetales bacterium]|nr:AmmeMemoRadiSam system radical SAM enzyme [Spirochaetales bacterium]
MIQRKKLSEVRVCNFCARSCHLDNGEVGACGVRKNIAGHITSLYYSKIASMAVEPIEKKPLYHFHPASRVLSLASFGCNFSCSFCQNYSIAQDYDPYFAYESESINPTNLPMIMEKEGVNLVAYTYSEPTVWQDYMLECCDWVSGNGGKNIMVTNGFFSSVALDKFTRSVDAFNIDLKGNRAFYQKHCGARIEPVLHSISRLISAGKHVEVTTLLIEDLHTLEDVREIARMVSDLGVKVWHLSRFYPAYKMSNSNRTSEPFLKEAIEIARSKDIDFVYGGNSQNISNSLTKCTKCSNVLIQRDQYNVHLINSRIENSKMFCNICGTELFGKY